MDKKIVSTKKNRTAAPRYDLAANAELSAAASVDTSAAASAANNNKSGPRIPLRQSESERVSQGGKKQTKSTSSPDDADIDKNTEKNNKVPIDEHIGRQLKAVYDDVLNQPVPDRFLDLLRQLDSDNGESK